MLDKSIPYQNIIMKIPAKDIFSICVPELPDGFPFRLFEDSDEVHWARIETSVLEFESEQVDKDSLSEIIFHI
ncbi:MAG: Acetyltransferase family [Firmicutes bacterium]|nr:Acetyltransferase family [Bacillota bacterium]